MRQVLGVICVVISLAFSLPAFGGTYTSTLTTANDWQFNDFYYMGRYTTWQPITDSGGDNWASYYFDSPPAFRNNWYSFLKFSLPTLSPGATVTAASLDIYVTGAGGWSVENRGNMAGGSGDVAGGGGAAYDSAGGWIGMDVTSAIQSDYAAAYTTAAFTISPRVWTSVSFASPLTSNGTLSPFLEIRTTGDPAPVPVPPAMLLLGSGFAGVAGLRKRLRRN
jgi:hypothetical protein